MKKHIYVIYTGGTLGMKKTERGFKPVPNWFEEQLRNLPELNADDMPNFTVHEYSPLLDSSDIRPEHWQCMANDIYANYDQYDGFVVLHGTDTMAYSAAALHYLIEDLGKPIIFTGAQIPLSEPNSDTPYNVRNALWAAANSGLQEVALLFDKKLLKAHYVTKFDAQSLDGFSSFNAAPIATWSGNYLTEISLKYKTENNQPKLNKINFENVGVLLFYPGMNYDFLEAYLSQKWDALVLYSFGAGNIPQHPKLWEMLTKLSEKNVKIINCTQCPKGEVQMKYSSGYMMADIGVISAADKTLEATVASAFI